MVLLFVPRMHRLFAIGPLALKVKAPALFVVAIAIAIVGLVRLQLLLGRVASRCPVPRDVSVAITAP